MTVPAASRRTSPFLGNDVATSFPFTFKVFQASDIAVVVTATSGALSTKVLNSDYSVTLNADQAASPGGSITYPLSGSPLATGEKLVIVGNLPYSQTLSLPQGGNYNPTAIERALDRTEMQIQQVADGVASAVRAPLGETLTELPDASTRANTVQAYDADGQPTVQVPASGSAADVLTQLADSSLVGRGDALVAVKHSATGGVARTQHGKNTDYVTALDFCVADGVTDDTAKVLNWLSAATTTGVWADGLGKTIAVTGNVDISAYTGLKLRDVTFKQLSPADVNRKTLYALSNDRMHLRKVRVLRNGDGTSGGLNDAAGVWLDNCDDVILEDCEVSGNDKGTAIALHSCARAQVIRPYVHDIRYVHTAETDDQVQGIWFNLCDDFSCQFPRVENMGRTDTTSAQRDMRSRGVVVGGCRGGTITSPQVYRADQGIDVTGGGGNSNIAVIGGEIRHVYSVGVKFANSATACRATGVVVENAGYYGFLASGPSSSQLNATQNVVFDSCTARNTGANQRFAADVGGLARGFSADRNSSSSPYGTYPKGIKFRNCDAVSDEGSSVVTVASTTTLTLASPIPVSLATRVRFTTSGTLPTGLALATDYWLVPIKDTMTVSVATSYINALDGTVVSTLAGGSGTHTMTLFQDMVYGYYNNVDGSAGAIDTINPNTTENCRSAGHTTRAFDGIHAPIVISTHSGQTIGTGAFADLTPNTDVVDSMALHDAGTPATDFLVPSSGMWRFEVQGTFAANATGSRRVLIQENTGGGYVNAGGNVIDTRPNNGAGTSTAVHLFHEAFYARGTLLKARAFQDSGGDLVFGYRITLRPATVHGGTI